MRGAVEANLLEVAQRDRALAHLRRDAPNNLFLIDMVARLGGPPAPGELPGEIVGAWREGELVGVAALRPSVALDTALDAECLEAMMPFFELLGVGLVKSRRDAVDGLWQRLTRRRGRRALLDRRETAYALACESPRWAAVGPQAPGRAATLADLEPLVVAARESLREESRPDPFAGDARGFRRWVRGRLSRARVVELDGRIVFVGYADVQRPEGWLLQGVYTWPDVRRRGLARAGMIDLCRQAFTAGTDHVQLAVVDDNAAGRALYEGLGFRPFASLRTILFT